MTGTLLPTEFGVETAERIEAEASAWTKSTRGMEKPRLATEAEVPVFDLSDCLKGSAGAVEAFADRLRVPSFDTGFYLLKGHGIAPELEDAVYAQCKRFNALPDDVKMKCRQNDLGVGWLKVNSRRQPRRVKGNMCESFYAKRDLSGRGITWDANQWPSELGSDFRDVITTYTESMEKMAKAVLPAYEKLLDLAPGFFDEPFRDAYLRLRMGHYPRVELEPDQYGVAPHVDTTFLTFLSRRETEPGLVILNEQDEWVKVPSIDGHFVVNSGELLRQWSNDRIRSTRHFANAYGEERRSVTFLLHPRSNYVMDSRDFPGCVTESRPARYPPFSYLDSQGPAQLE